MKKKEFYFTVPKFCKPLNTYSEYIDDGRIKVTLEYEESVKPKKGDYIAFTYPSNDCRARGIFKGVTGKGEYQFYHVYAPNQYISKKDVTILNLESINLLNEDQIKNYNEELFSLGLIWDGETMTLNSMDNWRQKEGFSYFYINFYSKNFDVIEKIEKNDDVDKENYNRGNYYMQHSFAEKISRKYREIDNEISRAKRGL